ncbi:UNVERIFIED_CONTAM: hypothetical protein K2H54_027273 [Gekko kuhli]
MRDLLTISFLASFIATGLSLSCETCVGFKNTCTGKWENCPPEKDSCSIIQMQGSGLMQVKAIAKSCIRSSSCAEPNRSVNLGRAGQMFTRTTCCRGNECQKIPPAFATKRITPGKVPPASGTPYEGLFRVWRFPDPLNVGKFSSSLE